MILFYFQGAAGGSPDVTSSAVRLTNMSSQNNDSSRSGELFCIC